MREVENLASLSFRAAEGRGVCYDPTLLGMTAGLLVVPPVSCNPEESASQDDEACLPTVFGEAGRDLDQMVAADFNLWTWNLNAI